VLGQPESRSQYAVGIGLASRVTAIALEFVVPMVLGYGLDRWLGTIPAATIVGLMLGFAMGLWHIRRLAQEMAGGPIRPPREPNEDRTPPPASSR
jgi:ATP synthase protein I